MAKKSPARRKRTAEQAEKFSDEKYEDVRFSATFDYNEISLARAAEMLTPHAQTVMLSATFVSLAGIVLVALVSEDLSNATFPLVMLFAVSVALLVARSNWAYYQTSFARGTTLNPEDHGGRMHVAVCDDAIHTQDAAGNEAAYPFLELRRVYATSESVLACFTDRRYVYVPREGLSENRFRELKHYLDERSPKSN